MSQNKSDMEGATNILKKKYPSSTSGNSYRNVKFIFKKIFEESNVPKFIVNKDGRIVEVNAELCNILGYTKSELKGEHFFKIIADDLLHKSQELHEKLTGNTQFLKVEEKYKRKNGTSFYALSTNIKVSDEYGSPFRVVSLIDISERMQYELVQSILLKISNEASFCKKPLYMYETIFSSISQIIPIDLFNVYMLNEKQTLIKIFSAKKERDKQYEKNFISKVMKNGKVILLKKNEVKKLIDTNKIVDRELPNYFLGIPLKLKNKSIGAISIFINESVNKNILSDLSFMNIIGDQIARVLERNKYENELKIAKEKAEEASNLKSEFLAQISHEVRTPLNSILSFSSLIESDLNGSLSDELKESFDMIRRGGERLRRTIELLLNASQIQNGKYKVHIENLDLVNNVLIPIIKQFEIAAKNKGLKLELENELEDTRVVCDLYTTGQIFINLIDNAIKYTNRGKISVKSFKNKTGKVQVDIVDTGIGISQKYMPKIFETFSQEESGYTRKYEGLGLGLALVKEYANINELDILVDSKKGSGTKFSVIFK